MHKRCIKTSTRKAGAGERSARVKGGPGLTTGDRQCAAGCGRSFEVRAGRGRPRKFCDECRPVSTPKGTLPPRTCPRCGGTFWPRTKRAVYCSRDCHERAHETRRVRTWPSKVPPAVCGNCGRTFARRVGRTPRWCDECRISAVTGGNRGVKDQSAKCPDPLAPQTTLSTGFQLFAPGPLQ
jgi:hypothetical protein